MRQRTSQILFNYWNDVRAGRLAPRRFEIEPARIAAILSETFIVERTDNQSYRFRLAGTRILEQIGRELRGSDLVELLTETVDRVTMHRQLRAISEQAAVGRFTLEVRASGQSGDRAARLEMLLLPLLHTQSNVSRLLGSLSAVEAPDWLGTEAVVNMRLVEHELIWPEGRPHNLLARSQIQSPFAPQVRGARIVAHNRRTFRVYDGGRADADGEER